MKITVKGVKEWERKYRKIQERYQGKGAGDPLRKAVHNGLGIVQAEVKKMLTGASGGVLFVRTGRLRASILVATKRLASLVRGEVGTDVFYGKIHELYGVGKKKKKRPFLHPSFQRKKKDVREYIANSWRNINRGK